MLDHRFVVLNEFMDVQAKELIVRAYFPAEQAIIKNLRSSSVDSQDTWLDLTIDDSVGRSTYLEEESLTTKL